MGLAGVTEAQGETGTALLRSASLAHSRSRGERSDMGSENKKSVSWVPPLRAGLAKFILGRTGEGPKPHRHDSTKMKEW